MDKLDFLLEEVESSYEWQDLIDKLEPFAKEKLGYEKTPEIELENDPENAALNQQAKTAYYDPNTSKIVIYVTDRHPKDVLRSICHELVHHKQHEDGRLDDVADVPAEDFLDNEALGELESEAYTLGGSILKDWTLNHDYKGGD
jgi:hypothetical protein